MPHFLSVQCVVPDAPQHLVAHAHPHKEVLVDSVKLVIVYVFVQSSDHKQIQLQTLEGKL